MSQQAENITIHPAYAQIGAISNEVYAHELYLHIHGKFGDQTRVKPDVVLREIMRFHMTYQLGAEVHVARPTSEGSGLIRTFIAEAAAFIFFLAGTFGALLAIWGLMS